MHIEDLYQKFLNCGSISIDTRNIKAGSIFFSLRGPHFNGNEFAQCALDSGAEYAVIDDSSFYINERTIYVNNGLQALQELATFHRQKCKIPVIGITGSNGKTTTKEVMNAVLNNKFVTLATSGNLNNHIGVPLTVLSINSHHEIAIIEMGANHVGEISLLSRIANPTHGLITNIGKAHIGSFGSLENIVKAKMELFQHLASNNGTAFINSKDSAITKSAKLLKFQHSVIYPNPSPEDSIQLVDSKPFVTLKTEIGTEIKTQIVGSYNFENIVAASSVGQYFGVPKNLIYDSVAKYLPNNMRSQLLESGSNRIIIDVYNANPDSMRMAIDNFIALKYRRKIVILGDMHELGKDAKQEHQKVGTQLNNSDIEQIYFCGPLMTLAQMQCPRSKSYNTLEELSKELIKNPIKNSTILLKGSRGMALEKLIPPLKSS